MIETNRLILRKWKESDILPYSELNSDPDVMHFFPKPLTPKETVEHVARINAHFEKWGYGLWAAEFKESNQFIGFIGLSHTGFDSDFTPCVEIGWRLNRNYWRKGLATEGARASLKYGFNTLQLEEIYSFTAIPNLPSERVMQKIGMQKIGTFLHPNLPPDHSLSDHLLYKIQVKEWRLSNQ